MTPCHFPLSTYSVRHCAQHFPCFSSLYLPKSPMGRTFGKSVPLGSTSIISILQMEGTEAQKGQSTCPRSKSHGTRT